jgi:hypothetical protein
MGTIDKGFKPPLTNNRSGIYRVSLSSEHAANARKRIVSQVSQILEERIARVKSANRLSDALLDPARVALQKSQDGSKRITEFLAAKKAAAHSQRRVSRNHANELTATIQKLAVLPPGLTVLTPPWDMTWAIPNDSTQFVNSTTDANDSMGTICFGSNNSANGFAASGYGIFINSPVQRPVSIRPYVPCDFGYSFWSSFYSSNSRGGYGVVIYDDANNIVPSTNQQPEIWDRTAMNDDRTHIDGSDYLQNHLANGEIAFTMNAGETYQLWVWVWGHGDCSGIVFTDIFGHEYGSYCDFQSTASMPFIVVL